MSRYNRKWLVNLLSLCLGLGLLYLALRNADLSTIRQSLLEADYILGIPLFIIVIISHLLRAWRWKMMLDTLPDAEGNIRLPGYSLRIAFYSVMIGYMVNYAAPRLGEFARTANMAAQEKVGFSSVLGTVVAERIFDILSLLLAIGSVLIIFRGTLGALGDLVFGPLAARMEGIDIFGIGLAILFTCALAYVALKLIRRWWRYSTGAFAAKTRGVFESFRAGLKSLIDSPSRAGILLTTVGMWVCYLLMAYIPFVMLGMTDPYNITLLDGWAIMVLGTLGIVVPSPGGIGSYHYVTVQILVLMFGVDESPAATYAVLTHAAQMILYIIIGFCCLLAQGSSFQKLRESTYPVNQDSQAVEAGSGD